MSLSNKTINNLANALLPEIIDYIDEDDRLREVLHEIIPDAVTEKFGQIDENLKYELSMRIMSSIFFTSNNVYD